jgi:hypothetical protein
MTPRDKLVTVPDGTTLRSQGAAQQAQARAAAGGQRRLRAQGPDHRQGHHEADQLPECRAGCAGQAARGRGGRRGRGHRGACRGAGARRRRCHRRRHGARPQPGRDRPGALGQAQLPAGRRDRRQHRHRCGRAGAGRGGCRRRQGRHRPGLDLHHPHRGRCRRAADHGHRQRGHGAQGQRRAADRRRRHPLQRRHRQGDRRRRQLGDDGRHVRRHRRGAGRNHPVPGPQLQELPRHGLDRRDAAGQCRPLFPGSQHRQPERRQAGARRASRGVFRTRDR